MEYSSEDVERAVWQFYHNDTTVQSQADEWLRKAKNSPEAWAFVWELIQPHRASEVQFFAANILHTKIKKSLNSLTPENVLLLRDKLLATIFSSVSAPKVVLNRLCISLSDYLLQTCPGLWPDALPSLLVTFTPENLPQMPPDKILWILFEILTVLPEQLSSMQLFQCQRGLVHHHLQEHTPSVISLLEKILTNHSDQEMVLQAIKCAASWVSVGTPFNQWQNLSNILVDLVFVAHKQHPGICENALEYLKVFVDHPENFKYDTYLLQFLTKILTLGEIIARELSLGDSADQEVVSDIYQLFIDFGGTYSRQCLNWIKEGGDAREQVMTLITLILQCSGARGNYPTDETYSRLAFGFWYVLQDEVCASSPPDREFFMKYLSPIYKELVNILIRKAQLPGPDQNFSEEDLESFRCYRQDISDTLMYCNCILRQTTIELIQSKLEKINIDETKWQNLEACLFSLCSISENIEAEEEDFLLSLFQYIRNLPFERLDTKVFCTAIDTIGAFADWISFHSSTLEYLLPIIIQGLNVPETGSSATIALKDLAGICEQEIRPYSSLILDASQKALHGGRLKLNDSQRLMTIVGMILSILPYDTIMQYLNLILTPYMDQLNSLALQEPSRQVKNNIMLCLKMLSSAALNIHAGCTTQLEPQPVLIILHKLLPVIKVIANSWSTDEQVMQSLFIVLKHSVQNLHDEIHSAITDVLDFIVTTFRVNPQPAALELSKSLCLLFGYKENYESMMQSLTTELCSVTMTKLSSAENLSDHTNLLEALFTFLAQIVKKAPKLVAAGDPVSLFQCATVTLAIPELPTVKAAASFIVNFINQSPETESFTEIVNAVGKQLDLQIVSCVAGKASRSNIEPLAQILVALNKNFHESQCRWIRDAVMESTCPNTSPQQRNKFISELITQRNKASMQETVKKFSLICRGLMGTEYGQSVTSFT